MNDAASLAFLRITSRIDEVARRGTDVEILCPNEAFPSVDWIARGQGAPSLSVVRHRVPWDRLRCKSEKIEGLLVFSPVNIVSRIHEGFLDSGSRCCVET